MGRMNRSRKRREENAKLKKARYDAKELERLKKTLGITENTDEVMKDISEVATVKTSKDIKREKKSKEEREMQFQIEEEREKPKFIKIVNEKTGKEHLYNSKTLKDQYGSYPPWFKPKKTAKRIRKKQHSLKKNFKQAWTTSNVPL